MKLFFVGSWEQNKEDLNHNNKDETKKNNELPKKTPRIS